MKHDLPSYSNMFQSTLPITSLYSSMYLATQEVIKAGLDSALHSICMLNNFLAIPSANCHSRQ